MAKKALALILTVLLALAFACPVFAETTIEHPKVIVYGNVTKTVYPGRNIFEYKDDQGLSSVLPFNRTNENITIPFYSIVFQNAFENKTIGKATVTSSDEVDATYEVLSANGIEYIYLKIINSSALATESYYTLRLDLTCNKTVTNDYYMLVTASIKNIAGDNLEVKARLQVLFTFLDSGATERNLGIKLTDGGQTADQWDNPYWVDARTSDGTFVTWQFKLGYMLQKFGVNAELSKLIKVSYRITFKTSTTLDASNGMEAKIVHAFLVPSKIYIDDPSYENGLIVNGTSGQFTPSAGDIIQVYGANATKIVDVTIPFVYEDNRDFDQICTAIAECYGFQYEWKFILPKSPTSGDKLEYSNTNITLKCWFDGAYIDKLYVNGVDKTTQVSGKKVDTSEGIQDKDRAWTYLVASSLTAGNQYDVELKIKDLPKQIWYDLTTEPTRILTWEWLYDKLLVILAFFSNLLGGIGSSWIKSQREKLRVPKR